MTQPTQQQTLQQQRAADAWRVTEGVPDRIQGKYGSAVRNFPALILSDGLAQALVFHKSKDGKSNNRNNTANMYLYRAVEAWAKKRFSFDQDLVEWLINQNSSMYRVVTTEILGYSIWLKRFAEAKGWESDEEDEE